MATTLTFTKQADGTWQGSFTSTGTRTIVQVERQENAPLYLNISADDGDHNVIYQPPKDFKNQILLIDIAEGALVTVVSHSAVTKAQYIASELEYYTKEETDELIRQIHQFEPVVVDVLPTASEDTMFKFYFVPKDNPETSNASDEYITVRYGTEGSYTYAWERIGDTTIDLSGYATLTYVDGKFIPIPDPLTNADGTIIKNIVKDYDGNSYDGVILNNKIWTVQNLRTTHYSDGTEISFGRDVLSSDYAQYHYPDLNENNVENYGLLYNWKAACRSNKSSNNPSGVQGLAFDGWHIPSESEFQDFLSYINSVSEYRYENTNNYIAKALASKDGWHQNNLPGCPGTLRNTNNKTNFNLKPSGRLYLVQDNVSYTNFNGRGCLWTTSEKDGYSTKIYYVIAANSRDVEKYYGEESLAMSVRCVMDISAEQWLSENPHHLKNTSNGLVWAPIAKVAETNSYNDLDNKPTIGTAAEKNVPASGNASNTEVVLGNDTRLSDSRTPTAHSHTVSDITDFPTNVSSFNNDAGYLTTETDPTVPSWAKAQNKPSYDYSEIQNTPTLPTSAQLLPAVTSSDNGKILIVDNGVWSASEVPVSDSVLH